MKITLDQAFIEGGTMAAPADKQTHRSENLSLCVINLRASSAPSTLPTLTGIAGADRYVYQIQRLEDGRMRYRLRVGPFAREQEASDVLAIVRAEFPQAFTAAAGPDDRQVIAALDGKRAEQRGHPPVLRSAERSPMQIPTLTVPVDVAVETSRAPAAMPMSSQQTRSPLRRASDLDSTRTVRALTPLELTKEEAPRWFVIQLSVSEQAFDSDKLPHHDLFSLYKLYSVVGMDQGRLVHALRLGFFAEEMAARTIANYLENYYSNPVIKRVSSAERDRFSEQQVEARMDVGATGRQAAIVITDELIVRERKTSP